MAVAGRIAQVITTGLPGASTDCRKNAVSSRVSVPWPTTMPATSGRASNSLQRRASARHTAKLMSLLSIRAISSDSSGRPRSAGTDASTVAIGNSPAR